jgi:Mn2+/Fe2+ NRAMP family transporter
VLAGAAAYAVAEARNWRGTLEDKPRLAKKFYAIVASAMILGLVLDYAGFNAVKMLFWSAVLNGVLAPPLIVLVVLLTGSQKIMGERANRPILKWLGWITAAVMAAAAIAMFATM